MTNPLLEAALSYATERLWPVFPCRADKTPYTKNGVIDATTNPNKIKEWWTTWPRANIGLDVGGAGMMVLDLDPGHDPAEFRQAFPDLPDTQLAQSTPRGGAHLFYQIGRDEVIAPSASKVAKKVDVRSFHSYVLLSPSRTADGSYTWDGEGKPAYRTDDMVRVCNVAKEKHDDRDSWIIEPDLPEHVDRAIEWLKKDAKIAVEGQGGDSTAYATGAMMKSFGISEELAFDLMWEHWNPRCNPPWSSDEADHLARKVENGYNYNTSPPGNCTDAYHVARKSTLFRPVRQELPSGKAVNVGRFRFTDREGMEHIRPPEWLVKDFLPAGGYAMLFGSPGTFKTFIALDIALSVATGVTTLGGGTWEQVRQSPVLFCVGEGRPQFKKRVQAWEQTYLGGEQSKDIILGDPVPSISEDVGPFLDGAMAMSPDGYGLVVIDTVGRAMQGTNENSQEHASAFTRLVEAIQAETGATVLALHHSGHDDEGRPRGSSVFGADADTLVWLQRPSKDYLVKLTMLKQKDAVEWAVPKPVKLAEVELGKDAKSLAVTQPTSADQAQEKRSKAAEQLIEDANASIIDKAVERVMDANRIKPWSTTKLAEAVAAQPDINISSKSLRNRFLIALREDKSRKAWRFYDPMTERWRWRDPE